MKNIAIVVPSHKQELTELFLNKWQPLFDKHDVEFILVVDGKKPHIEHSSFPFKSIGQRVDLKSDLVSNFCAGVRQMGFLYIAKYLPEVEYILTFDTDTSPIGDPIQDHIDQLNRKVPISWLSTGVDDYFRGFPYGVREEAPVMLSHGVWDGSYDWDAPSQLLKGDARVDFYKGVIPKGIFFPMCG